MKAHLTNATVNPVMQIALQTEGRFVIGRSHAADFPLDDPTVSRQHCALIITSNAVQVEDLASSTGTFVNGSRLLGCMRINNGDRITVGNTTFNFSANSDPCEIERYDGVEPQSIPVVLDPEATMLCRPGAPRQAATRETASATVLGVSPSIQLKTRLVIGRDPLCDMPLTSREISRHHAEIREDHGVYTVRDLSSTNGTFLNGVEVRGSIQLLEGSRLRVGPYTFLLRNKCLLPSCQKGNVRVALQQITKTVTNRDTGQTLKLLDNISLVIEPNEFVALLGTSGSGKSTLMDAINGRRPASTGRVIVNDDDFYRAYRYYRRAIGYVPQQDIVHTRLTVKQAFDFTARLRLPKDTSTEEIDRIVTDTIEKMGLADRRHTMIANLSGGQLKRVSLGVELIADPCLLFLDEATSGLDAGTEAKMMALFRQIADEGKTVVCITHNLENVRLCDLVVVLTRGKLAYYGPPAQLPVYFDVNKITEVYERLEGRSPEDWEKTYLASSQYQHYVQERQKKTNISAEVAKQAKSESAPGGSLAECMRQFYVLTERYAILTLQDRKNVSILLAQAPVIALLLALVFSEDKSAPQIAKANAHKLVVFLMAISAIWFGCTNAAKEVVKELPIYLRERAVNLRLSAYLGSKICVLSVLCAVQCVTLLAIVSPLVGLEAQSGALFATLFLTTLCGMMMGLVVSSLVDNSDKAMAIVPILLIPQVIFAGGIKALTGWPEFIGHWLIISYWSFEAMLNSLSADVITILKPVHPWRQDVVSLLLFLLVFFSASLWALRRKDSLR
jgi:ABC-type multidrug transport system ATPase subunit